MLAPMTAGSAWHTLGLTPEAKGRRSPRARSIAPLHRPTPEPPPPIAALLREATGASPTISRLLTPSPQHQHGPTCLKQAKPSHYRQRWHRFCIAKCGRFWIGDGCVSTVSMGTVFRVCREPAIIATTGAGDSGRVFRHRACTRLLATMDGTTMSIRAPPSDRCSSSSAVCRSEAGITGHW